MTGVIVLPWILRVHNITGSPLGALAQRAKGEELELLRDPETWGARELRTLVKTLTLRSMPSGPFRVVYAAAFLYSVFSIVRRKAPRGLPLAIILIGSWLLVFQVFLPLPMTRRQLIPLLPVFNVLAALLVIRIWDWVDARISGMLPTVFRRVAGSLGATGLILLNFPPGFWPEVRPLDLFESPGPRFLEAETLAAMKSVDNADLLTSNYPSLLCILGGRSRCPFLCFMGERSGKDQRASTQGKEEKEIPS